MSRSLSAFIDACRVAAACVVLFGHLDALGYVPLDLAGRPNRAGHDAVIVFFVLSGLVIAHAAATTQCTARAYAVARASRVYSVAVPAVLIGYALDRIGMELGATTGYPDYQFRKWPLYMGFQWLFLGEAWTGSSVVPFSNVPYWSLSYEVWYYALFGVAAFTRGAARGVLVVLVLAAMGPKPWLLLPAWLGGVALYRVIARPATGRLHEAPPRALPRTALPPRAPPGAPDRMRACTAAGRTVWAAAIAAGAAGYALFVITGAQAALEGYSQRILGAVQAGLGIEPAAHLGYSRFFLADWVTAALFALALLGVARLAPPAPARLARAASALAGMSFTLYLLHYPLLLMLRATGALDLPSWPAAATAASIVLGATAIVARLFEQRRDPWRRLFGAAWDLLSRRPAR